MNQTSAPVNSNLFYPLNEFGSPIQQAVMPLVTIVGDSVIPLGSGFMVSPDGLMMTAMHVVDEALATMQRRLDESGRYYDHYELYALFVDADGEPKEPNHRYGGLWPIDKVWASPNLDIAYCWLRSATKKDVPFRFQVLRLSPGLPQVGTPIRGFGYYKMQSNTIETGIDKKVVNYSQNTAHSHGKIMEVHPKLRDAGMLSFPCFQTDARFDHGMSGGPILNDSGDVCGVICSSFPTLPEDDRHISYGSLIWPAFGTSIELRLSNESETEPILVLDLAKRGFLVCDATLSEVAVSVNADGTRIVQIRSA